MIVQFYYYLLFVCNDSYSCILEASFVLKHIHHRWIELSSFYLFIFFMLKKKSRHQLLIVMLFNFINYDQWSELFSLVFCLLHHHQIIHNHFNNEAIRKESILCSNLRSSFPINGVNRMNNRFLFLYYFEAL